VPMEAFVDAFARVGGAAPRRVLFDLPEEE
jgi:hypothetical protein